MAEPTHQSTCEMCKVVLAMMDVVMTEVIARTEPDTPGELERHVLGAICAWWAAKALVVTKGDVHEVLSCVAHVMAEHGVEVGLAHLAQEEAVGKPH
jgi:hypothetical protein